MLKEEYHPPTIREIYLIVQHYPFWHLLNPFVALQKIRRDRTSCVFYGKREKRERTRERERTQHCHCPEESTQKIGAGVNKCCHALERPSP